MRSSEFKGLFQVLAAKRLRNSYYGNPKWELAVQAINPEHDSSYIATTQTNAVCGYYLGYHSIKRIYEITGYFTKKGNMIIKTAREV